MPDRQDKSGTGCIDAAQDRVPASVMLATHPAPAQSSSHPRRSWPYTAGSPRRAQAAEQIRQHEQVFGA